MERLDVLEDHQDHNFMEPLEAEVVPGPLVPGAKYEPFATAPIEERDYLSQANAHVRDFKRGKNSILIFRPGNFYEGYLAHGAIPFAFKSFICNPTYVGRGELALYVRLSLLTDQFGICYPTYEELARDMYSKPKQVAPIMASLIERHMVLRSPSPVKVPWMRGAARYVYQRPSAAYTVARLHYLGFVDAKKGPVFLDVEAFDRCARALMEAYASRVERRTRAAGDKRALKPEASPPPEARGNGLAFKAWLRETFLREEERMGLLLTPEGNNLAAPTGNREADDLADAEVPLD